MIPSDLALRLNNEYQVALEDARKINELSVLSEEARNIRRIDLDGKTVNEFVKFKLGVKPWK